MRLLVRLNVDKCILLAVICIEKKTRGIDGKNMSGYLRVMTPMKLI